MRRAPVTLALGLSSALLVLAGCGEGGDPATSASPSAPPPSTPSASTPASPSASAAKVPVSKNLDAIKVSGDYGKSPKVTFKAPFAIDKTQTKVIKPSDGAAVKEGSSVEVNYYGVNARTGKKFDDSYSRGQTATFSLAQVVPGFQKGLTGQKQGSRILVAMPGPDGYDASGGNEQAGIKVGDTLIFVIDVVGVPLAGPQGEAVTPKAGLPTVGGTADKPTISVPKSAPPKTLQVQPLIKGTGKKIGPQDSITFNYLWVAYKDGRTLETSYGSQPAETQLAGLLPGMAKGLAGQTVGSRVLLVIPPDQGYGKQGNPKPKVEPGETLVMVVDLLFSAPAM